MALSHNGIDCYQGKKYNVNCFQKLTYRLVEINFHKKKCLQLISDTPRSLSISFELIFFDQAITS
jgi:hypothetical protein